MIAFPLLLVSPAKEAGIRVPPEDQIENDAYDKTEFAHWHVYCAIQLGAPMPDANSHWDNAKLIAQIPDSQIKTVTGGDLAKLGIV